MPDPRQPQDLNRYTYARNNPFGYTDPTGHEGEPADGGWGWGAWWGGIYGWFMNLLFGPPITPPATLMSAPLLPMGDLGGQLQFDSPMARRLGVDSTTLLTTPTDRALASQVAQGMSRDFLLGAGVVSGGASLIRSLPGLFEEGITAFRSLLGFGEANAPASVLAPGGGLKAHELAGGHLLEKHIGLSETALEIRLSAEPGLQAASSFFDRSMAEFAASQALQYNSQLVSQWLAGNAPRLQLSVSLGQPVGIVLPRGGVAIPGTSAEFSLVRDPRLATGFRIQTGYINP